MKNIFISTSITILFLCLGCVPYHQHIHRVPDEKTLESIKKGVTSKEDNLMMVGEPDRVRDNEKLFSYWWQEVDGVIGIGPMGSNTRTYSLHIEFDENNIVKWFEIKKKGMFDEFYEDSEWTPSESKYRCDTQLDVSSDP